MDNIIITGKIVRLEKPTAEITRNLWLGLLAEFKLYQFTMNDREQLLLVAKETADYSPSLRANIAQRVEDATHIPAVFYFENMATYERDRLVDKGVYFVVSDKFAFIPSLLANRRLSKNEMPDKLLPSTQYLVMLHLQGHSLNGMSLKDIAGITPYKYATLAKSLQQLVALKLAEVSAEGGKTKRLQFSAAGRELWDKALPYLINPIKQSGFLALPLRQGVIGGIDALSHYSMLAGEKIPTRVFAADEIKELGLTLSRYEDTQRVEVWKYPPIAEDGFVDRLSLYLTLREDHDPRVEQELETMINEMPW